MKETRAIYSEASTVEACIAPSASIASRGSATENYVQRVFPSVKERYMVAAFNCNTETRQGHSTLQSGK